MMPPRLALLALLALAHLAALPACTADLSEEDASTSSEAELGAMPAAAILGTTAYGDVKTVAYTATPRYRAFSFKAAVGDLVKVRVTPQTAGSKPMAWLLQQNFRTIVQQAGDQSGA